MKVIAWPAAFAAGLVLFGVWRALLPSRPADSLFSSTDDSLPVTEHDLEPYAFTLKGRLFTSIVLRGLALALIVLIAAPGGLVAPPEASAGGIHGAPATVTIAPPSATRTVGEVHTLTATAQDLAMLAIGPGETATMVVTGPGATTTSTTTDSSGRAVFSFSATQSGTSLITITVTSVTPPGSAFGTASVAWTAGPLDHYDIEAPAAQHVDDCFAVTVTARDQYGNLRTDDSSNVLLSSSSDDGTSDLGFYSDSGCASLVGNVVLSGGQGTRFAKSADPETVTITATQVGGSGATGSSDPIEIQGDPVIYGVTPTTLNWTAGTAVTVTVTAFDENGKVVTTDSESEVTLTSSSGNVQFDADRNGTFGDASGTLSTGLLIVHAKDDVLETVTVTAVDQSGVTGTSEPISVTAGAPASIALEPPSGSNVVGYPHFMTATVEDQVGNSVPDGTTVTFTVIGVGAQVTTTTTTAGEAYFSFTSTQVGTSTITASAFGTGTVTSNVATKTWRADVAAIQLEPVTATNGAGETHFMTATVTDTSGNPVPDGTPVTFTVIGVGAQVTATTTTAGEAYFSFSSTEPGSSTITASALGTETVVSNVATKTWTAGERDHYEITFESPQTVSSCFLITVTVHDEFGNFVADDSSEAFLDSTSNDGTSNLEFFSDGSCINEVFTVTISSGTGSRFARDLDAETVTITAEQFGPPSPPISGTSGPLVILADVAASVELDPPSGENTVGDTHFMTATVTDEFGNPVADGTTVTFTVTGVGSQVSATTTTAGEAYFSFSSTEPGSSTITASAFGTETVVSNVATKTWTADFADEISLDPESATNAVGETHTVTATVTDEFGNPVTDGTVVTFTVIGNGAGSGTDTTTDGEATFQFTSAQPGSSTITAVVQGETQTLTSNQATKNWHHGAPATVTVIQATETNTVGDTHTVTATATDETGVPIANHGATLTVTGAGAQTQPGTTDDEGVVVFSFTSTEPGTSQITVTVWSSGADASGVGAGSAFATASKLWEVGPAAHITLEPESATNAVGETHFMTATVTDEFGNPVTDGTVVTFTVIGNGAGSGTDTTTNGEATFQFTSAQPGFSTITAVVQGETQTLTSNQATKTWHHGAPATVTVIPATDTNTVGETHTVIATATDETGVPIANHGATLTVTGAGAQTQTGVTDDEGVVVFSFTSTEPGNSQITITVWSSGADASGVGAGIAFATASKVWEVGPAANITLEPETSSNPIGTTHTVTATVEDEFGNRVPDGQVVTFTVIGNGASTGTDTTTNGQATFQFSSTQSGVSTATATTEGESGPVVSNEAIKFWSGPPASITLEPPTATNAAGETHTVTATVTDAFGNPASDGSVVTFTVAGQGATVGTSSISGGQGKATFQFSSTQSGSSTITATVQGETQTLTSNPVTKTWHHAAPFQVVVTPPSETNPVGDTHTVTGTATDEFGNPIANHGATLTVTGAGAQTKTGNTDANGVVVFTFTSTQPGTSQVTVTVWSSGSDASGAGSGSAFGTATKQWEVGEAANITLEPETASNRVGTTHTITATVEDEFGNLVADGQVVTFTVIGKGAGSGTDSTTNGQATFQFSSTQSGVSTATATTDGETQTLVSNEAIKFWSGPATTITLEPPTATNAAGETHTVTATVTDAFANPAADGSLVTFTVVGEGATVGTSTISGGQGKAIFSFSSTQTGSSTITAAVQGETQTLVSNAVEKTWHHAAPAAIAFSPSDPTEFEGNTLTVVATATDQFGNAIANHDVDFSKSGKPGTVPASDSTDGNGVVTFSVYATTTGIQILTMTVSSDGSDASGAGAGSFSAPNTITWVGKRFTPLPPLRILDTRADNETGDPIGTCTPSPCATIPPNSSIEVEINGHGGVPASAVGAVKLNATVDQPSASGFLTLYPKGQAQPVVSNLNFTPGDVRANLATVKVGTGGRIIAFNGSLGPLDVIFDVSGWYGDGTQATEGGSFVSIDPERLMDTRDGTGGTSGPIPPDGSVTLTVVGVGGVPASGVNAVVLNATIDNPQAAGFLTVYPAGQARPLASNVNFVAGEIVPNLTAVKAGTSGQVVFFNGSPNTVEMVADVFGYFTAPSSTVGGGSIEPLDPNRILDTRAPNEFGASAIGDCTPSPCAAIGAGQTIDVQVAGQGGVPVTAVAVVMNATVDQPTHQGFLTIFPAGQETPLISNLNFVPGDAVPNLVMMKLGAGGKVTIFNGSSGTVHVIFDVNGWFRPILTLVPAEVDGGTG